MDDLSSLWIGTCIIWVIALDRMARVAGDRSQNQHGCAFYNFLLLGRQLVIHPKKHHQIFRTFV